MHEHAAIILAGGDGTRLRSLTRQLVGDDRPKQFCPVLGHRTLLDQTRRRAAQLIAPDQALFVVNRAHEAYYVPGLADVDPRNVIVQPANRGTVPAILYALERQKVVAPADAVVVLPSDHYVSDDVAFMARVERAFEAVAAQPGYVVMLGIEPVRPETGYGWISPGEVILDHSGWPIYRVRRFWEKPPLAAAEALMRSGALWNSFVIVAHPGNLSQLIQRVLPDVAAMLAPLVAHIDTSREAQMARSLYATMPATDLSKDVLQKAPESLAVLPVTGVTWSDLGVPERVLAARQSQVARLVAV